MKKITVISIVIIMLAASVMPAMAAGGPPADRGAVSGNCTGNQAGLTSQSQVRHGSGRLTEFGLRNPYALSGTISAIDTNPKTITVTLTCGNWMVKSYIGSDVTLQTNASTRFLLRDEDGSVSLKTFADLVIGETVSSHGTLIDNVWTASRITMGARLSCVN